MIALPKSCSSKQAGEMFRFSLVFLFAALFWAPNSVQAQFRVAEKADQKSENLEIHADVTDFDRATGVARASGEVIIKLGDITIEADEAEYSQNSGIIRAAGNVRLFKGNQVFNAEELFYDTATEEVTASHIRSALEPFFYQTDRIVIPREEGAPIEMENAEITTHDAADSDYRVVAKRLTIYPDDKAVIRKARLKIGDATVLGFPYYVQPFDGDLGYLAVPGWSSAWGAYVLNRYGFMINDDLLAQAKLDYRTERGVAGGLDILSQKFRGNGAIGRLKLYYANDKNPDIRYNGTTQPAGVPHDRYRINLQHRVYLASEKDETFYLDVDVNKLSDPFIYQDFFPNDYRLDPKPDNVVALTKRFDIAEATAVGRFDANDFFHTDSRVEGALDVVRTPLLGTKFFYDGFTSYGRLDEHFGDDTVVGFFTNPVTGYNRFTTYHELVRPHTFGGWLNVAPRAGIGYQNYSNFEIAGLDSFDRAIYHGGLDMSFKLSKKNPNIYNRALGIDGLMHVVQPYLNYSVIGADEIGQRFTPIDRYTPSTRLRPIDVPLFTAIDEYRNMHVLRSGISNRWYTRRNSRSYEWLSIDNYFDTYFEDPEFGRQFSNLFTDVRWSPVRWLQMQTTAQVPVFNTQFDFTEIKTRFHFMPNDWFRFSVGHYYLNDHPFFQDTDLFTLSTYTRLGDEWGFSTEHRYEADDGVLEYQQYAVHKDIGSWVATVGAMVRDNRITDKEFGVFLSLTLKAFPKVHIPVDYSPGTTGF